MLGLFSYLRSVSSVSQWLKTIPPSLETAAKPETIPYSDELKSVLSNQSERYAFLGADILAARNRVMLSIGREHAKTPTGNEIRSSSVSIPRKTDSPLSDADLLQDSYQRLYGHDATFSEEAYQRMLRG